MPVQRPQVHDTSADYDHEKDCHEDDDDQEGHSRPHESPEYSYDLSDEGEAEEEEEERDGECEERGGTGDDSADHQVLREVHWEGVTYNREDISVLNEIIALTCAGAEKQRFDDIWPAYDIVLKARGRDCVNETKLFKFIVKLQSVPGNDLKEKFHYRLQEMGWDEDTVGESEHTAEMEQQYQERLSMVEDDDEDEELPGPAGDERLQKTFLTAKKGPVHGEEEEESYHADTDDSLSRRRPRQTRISNRARLEVRQSKRRTSPKAHLFPTDSAVKAALIAGENYTHHINVPERRKAALARAGVSSGDEAAPDYLAHLDPDYLPPPQVELSQMEAVGNEMFKSKRKKLVKKHLRLWRENLAKTQEKRFFDELEACAVEKYTKTLMIKAWHSWISKTAAIVQRTYEMRQRILARKYFHAWKSVVEKNEARVRSFQLRQVWEQWRATLWERRQQELLAERFYNNGLKDMIIKQWHYKVVGNLTHRRTVERTMVTAFYQWVERAETVKKQTIIAEAFYRRKTLLQFFSHWLARSEQVIDDQLDASQYSDWKLVSTNFETWRNQARLLPICRAMQAITADRICYEALKKWRERTNLHIAAAELYKKNLARRILRDMRLEFRRRAFTSEHNKQLFRDIIKQLCLQGRFSVERRKLVRESGIRVMQLFKSRLRERGDKLQTAQEATVQLVRGNLASSVLSTWRQKLIKQREDSARADIYYNRHLLLTFFDHWHASYSAHALNQTRAKAGHTFFIMRRALWTLRDAAMEHKKSRLKLAYQHTAHHRKRSLATYVFHLWRSRTADLRAAQLTAEDNHRRDLTGLVFTNWRIRLQNLDTSYTEAAEFNRRRLLRLALATWADNLQLHRNMDFRADQLLLDHEFGLKLEVLRRWRHRIDMIGVLNKTLQRALERQRNNMKRHVLLSWRDRANVRAHGEQPPDLFAASTMTVRPLPSYQALLGSMTPLISSTRDGAAALRTPATGWKMVGRPGLGGGGRRSSLLGQSMMSQQGRDGNMTVPRAQPLPPLTFTQPRFPPQRSQQQVGFMGMGPVTPLGSPVKRRLFSRSVMGGTTTTRPPFPRTPAMGGRVARVGEEVEEVEDEEEEEEESEWGGSRRGGPGGFRSGGGGGLEGLGNLRSGSAMRSEMTEEEEEEEEEDGTLVGTLGTSRRGKGSVNS